MAVAAAARADAASVFVNSTGNDFSATGWRVNITAPPWPPTTYDNKVYFLMESAVLRDGTLLQVGWTGLLNPSCPTNAFFAFAQNTVTQEVYTYPVVCQASNVPHLFTWELYAASGGYYCFRALVDATLISRPTEPGTACVTAHDNGTHQPYLQAELEVGNDPRDSLGPAQFWDWSFRTSQWYRIQSARYYLADDTYCPAYGGRTYGFNNVQIGSNNFCFFNGQTAWG